MCVCEIDNLVCGSDVPITIIIVINNVAFLFTILSIHIHICSLVRLVIAILPQICSVCSTASLSIPLSPSHSSVLWLALWILLFFSLSFSRFLVLLLLASFHCAPKLTSSAPNYLRKLRVKSRQPVIYFTSIEVEKNQVAPEERLQRVRLV